MQLSFRKSEITTPCKEQSEWLSCDFTGTLGKTLLDNMSDLIYLLIMDPTHISLIKPGFRRDISLRLLQMGTKLSLPES